MPTPKQLQLIHTAARQIGLIEPGADGDARYRLLLENVAGVSSAKDLDNVKFEDVMAVMEDMGYSDARQRHIDRGGFMGVSGAAGRAQSTYWRDKVANRGTRANERLVHKIRELAAACPRYPLSNVCMKFSNRRTEHPEKLTPREAFEVIEMLKAAAAREGTVQRRGASNEGETADGRGSPAEADQGRPGIAGVEPHRRTARPAVPGGTAPRVGRGLFGAGDD